MIYPIEGIKKDVRVVLDNNMSSEALISEEDTDTLSLDEIIAYNIAYAARSVLSDAPVYLLGDGVILPSELQWESAPGYGMGYMLLPPDFFRLITFQMTDWERPVNSFITEDSDLYSRQRSRYPGVRGNPQRPIVAVVQYPAGKVLEFYTCSGGEKTAVKRARYLPYPVVSDGGIELPDRCYQSIVWAIASRVCSVLSENDRAASLSTISKDLLR